MNFLASGEIHGISHGVLRLVPSEVDYRTSIYENWYHFQCNVFCMVHAVPDFVKIGRPHWSSLATGRVTLLV